MLRREVHYLGRGRHKTACPGKLSGYEIRLGNRMGHIASVEGI